MANKEWFAELREMIENTYINGYMNALSIKWSSSIEGLQEYWGIGSVHYQWEFYQHWIEPHVQKGERVFVIISDGLRYEAAREFAKSSILRGEAPRNIRCSRCTASYTKLGMASLLPHRNIELFWLWDKCWRYFYRGDWEPQQILNKYVEKVLQSSTKTLLIWQGMIWGSCWAARIWSISIRTALMPGEITTLLNEKYLMR